MLRWFIVKNYYIVFSQLPFGFNFPRKLEWMKTEKKELCEFVTFFVMAHNSCVINED